MRRVLSYARVSTTEQATEGLSLDAQAAAMRAYCTGRGLELAGAIEDRGVSAGKPLSTRTGGARLLARLEAGEADAVIAVRLDRLFRNVQDCLEVTGRWRTRGVALVLLDLGGSPVETSSPFGEFMLTVLAAVATWERSMVRARTKAAMQHKKANGEWTGGCAPYGFTVDKQGKLVKEPAEQKVIATMRELRDAGESLRAIADILRAQGCSARGRRWYPMTVSRALSRPGS